VADERVETVPCLVTDTLMDDLEAMRQLARKILDFGSSLRA
jgi:hypothetical protein